MMNVEYTNRVTTSTIRQILHGYWNNSPEYIRFTNNGGASWSDWTRVFGNATLIPVSGGGTGANTIESAQSVLGIASLINQKVARADFSEVTLSRSWLGYPQFMFKMPDGMSYNLLITATGLRMRTAADGSSWTDLWQLNIS